MRAVIFDMDGVLCSTVAYHYQAWKKTVAPLGIPFTPEDNEKLRGLSRRRSLEVILDGAELHEDRIQALLEEKNRHYMEFLQQMTPADLAPGVRGLLEELRAAGIKIGVASASKNVRPTLRRLEIESFFEAICDGNTTSASKPDPFPYLHTAAQLGLEPAACLALEDSPAGIQSAQAAGMCVIGLGAPELVGEAQAAYPDLGNVRLAELLAVYSVWLKGRKRAHYPSQVINSPPPS